MAARNPQRAALRAAYNKAHKGQPKTAAYKAKRRTAISGAMRANKPQNVHPGVQQGGGAANPKAKYLDGMYVQEGRYSQQPYYTKPFAVSPAKKKTPPPGVMKSI